MLKHFHPELKQHLLCDGKGLHTDEPLDMICTNILCRQNPLACSVCYDQKHKFHKVVGLSKFIGEFARQSHHYDRKLLDPEIMRVQKSAKAVCAELREKINKRLDDFEQDIDQYAEYLLSEFDLQNQIRNLVGLEATPERMAETINLDELRKSIRFILNNSQFDDEVNLAKIASPLQANNEKILFMLSKLEYTSFECLRRVETELEKMRELADTLHTQKRNTPRVIKGDHTPFAEVSLKGVKTLESTNIKRTDQEPTERITTIKPFTTPSKSQIHDHNYQSTASKGHSIIDRPNFKFNFRHPDLSLIKNVLKSNVHGKEAHFALASPSLDQLPTSKWQIKILTCRDIFCNNSLAVGLCHLSEIKAKHFSSRVNDLNDCYLLNASGDVLTPTSLTNNPEMRFSAGDHLEFSYDSSFGQLEIKNEQGNILSISTEKRDQDPLCICVRMTFQNDAVELINI